MVLSEVKKNDSYIIATIPEEIEEKYNHSLKPLKPGDGTLIGNKEEMTSIIDSFNNPALSGDLILGEPGIGKTALLEQLLYIHPNIIAIALTIEVLGELGEELMISRMSTLLDDMKLVEAVNKKNNPGRNLEVVLFIDEIHKLNNYGRSGVSSAALNALKEKLARSAFKVVAATTDKEYSENLSNDEAIVRRFSKTILKQPPIHDVVPIIKKRWKFWKNEAQTNGEYFPKIKKGVFEEIVKYAESYIKDQVNPAKSIAVLGQVIGKATTNYQETGIDKPIDHETVVQVFNNQGYNLDIKVSPSTARSIITKRIKGQPIAVQTVLDTIDVANYTVRDSNKPLQTALFVGTTGVGKTEMAKTLANVYFGRDDAMVFLNGGDYSTSADAVKALHDIGDNVQTDHRKVILLDEIEKSHKDVQKAYMRLIDDGIVKDSKDIERSLNNTLIIGTSNLGAEAMGKLEGVMHRDRERNPNEWTQEKADQWFIHKQDILDALVAGDTGQNNGMKPEFIERFGAVVPFFSLPKKTRAEIMRNKLLEFQAEEKSLGYHIQLPAVKSYDEWKMLIPNSVYDNVDPISVMFAEDIMGKRNDRTGARAIRRYIEESVKPKFARIASRLDEEGIATDGAFLIKTNGFATFEIGQKRGVADVAIDYIPKEKMFN